jgi:cysteine desulfurase
MVSILNSLNLISKSVEPIYDIENIVSNSNALLHVDAVQAISHLDIKFSEFNILLCPLHY